MSTPLVQTAVLLSAFATLARAQAQDANQGPFAAAPGLLAVDAATGLPDRLLVKDPGYATAYPNERAPLDGAPDFRAGALWYGQLFPPTGTLAIDGFSLGMDWIVSDDQGETRGPEGHFAVMLFSVTRGTQGEANSVVAAESGNGQDGAAGDLFCYEFTRSPTPGVPEDLVTRAFDSTDVNLTPAAGTANMTGYDHFAWLFASPEFRAKLPKQVTVYFTVTAATAPFVPLEWCGRQQANRSGATIFQTTWRTVSRTWGTPSVYRSPGNLNLVPGDDVDALAIDTSHHANHYVLFSTANPPAGSARLRFHNRGNGFNGTYRYANGGPTVESRLRIGPGGDVDAVCLIDPGADELFADAAGQTIAGPPGLPAPGPVAATARRAFGTDEIHVFGASNTSGPHELYAWYPDAPGAPLLGPFPAVRNPAFKGSPSFVARLMSAARTVQRVAFAIVEAGAVASRFVMLREWADTLLTVTTPAGLATAEGTTSPLIWDATENRVQCFFGAANFMAQGTNHPIVIDTVEFRHGGGLSGAAVHYPNVELWLGYAATGYAAPSTTFATNRTASHTLVYSGPIDVLPAWEARPNRFTIRADLATPFTYDPGLGQDLLFEIVILAAPVPPVASVMSTSFSIFSHAANTVRSLGTTTATTGATSALCPVCRFGYTVPAGTARNTAYGTGCYDRAVSFHEQFAGGAFDLAGAPVHSMLMVPSIGGWVVLPGSNGWRAPTTPGLGLGDDQVVTFTLPGPFTFPDGSPGGFGSTTQLRICSNGFLTLNGTSTNASYIPSASELHAGEPRLCALWADLLPDGAANLANVYAEVDATTNTVYVTWLGVATYTPGGVVTMQVAIDLTTGTVEYRWQGCTVPSPTLVGWSPGGNARNAGSRDLTDVPFSVTRDMPPLRLFAPSRAVTGTTITYTVADIDPGAVFSALLLSLGGVDPGLDLGFLGMPGCRAYVDLATASTFVLFGGPVVAHLLAIPNDPSLVGLPIDTQAAAMLPGVNALGAVTSNGLLTTIGTL